MQSWGFRSRFDYRDTALEPTRSGVIGLLCAAMGIARGEDISRFDALRMGVRVEKDGRPEQDYHTALDVIKADGTKPDGTSKFTVVSRRDYLADAAFLVGLESDDRGLLDEIVKALHHPQWILFLGRKSFPLAVPPVKSGDVPLEGTLEDHLYKKEGDCRVVLELADGERTQHDWPLCFGERRFRPRRVKTTFDSKGAPE